MKQFILIISLISAALALVGWLVFSQFIPQYYLPVFPFLLLFFAVSSVIIHAYQHRLAKNDPGKFIRSTLLVTFLKLFLYAAVAIIYIAVDTENAKVFVVCYVALYFVFSIFEVSSLIRTTSKNKNKG